MSRLKWPCVAFAVRARIAREARELRAMGMIAMAETVSQDSTDLYYFIESSSDMGEIRLNVRLASATSPEPLNGPQTVAL